MLNLWHLAKAIEAEGSKMYKELAYNAPKKTIAGLFIMMAGEERLHYELFDKLENGMTIALEKNKPAAIDLQKIFEVIHTELLIDELSFSAKDNSETTYQKALVLENSSMDLFNIILRKVTDEYQQLVVGLIIEEEKRHVAIIEGVIELAHHPKVSLENANRVHYSNISNCQ